MLKLLGFVAAASWVLWIAGWFSVKRAGYWSAKRGLRGEGGKYEAWRPWLAVPVFGAGLAAVAWWGYGTVAPRAPIAEAAGLWNSFIALTLGALWWIGGICVVAAAPLAAVISAHKQSRAIRRRQLLKREAKNLSRVRAEHDREAVTARGRKIVICCDGTGNRPPKRDGSGPPRERNVQSVLMGSEEGEETGAVTNVYKMFRALKNNESQVVWYDPGVATDSSPSSRRVARVGKAASVIGIRPVAFISWFFAAVVRLKEAATGSGIQDNVIEAYIFLARTYRPGDQIYLIGFSRGAWTVRCLATVIECCGVLKPSCTRYAGDVAHFVRDRDKPDDQVWMRDDVTDMSARVAFLGVFDMVAALGFPLWGWWFRIFVSPQIAWTKNPLSVCDKVCHAISMDEKRSQYFVTLFDESEMEGQIEQVWFRGDHSDIGGGRPDTALSDITLEWMIEKAKELDFKEPEELSKRLRGDCLGFIHDELEVRRHWRLFSSWPRWFPAHGPEDATVSEHGTLHDTVHKRAQAMHAAGRHDLVFLSDDQPVEIEVQSDREWCRSGIVLERGQIYCLRWLGDSKWRSGTNEECGPAGEPCVDGRVFNRILAIRILRALLMAVARFQRRRFPAADENGRPDWDRRKSEVPRMTLIATHAHPRAWPPKEGRVRELARLFFWRDPIQLVEQLAPIGMDLPSQDDGSPANGRSVYLEIGQDVPNGMLWLFANDKWMSAWDNSGAVRLSIQRVTAREPDRPLWSLKRDEGGEPRRPREHPVLRMLNKQTEADQKTERQPRAVWSCDPPMVSHPGNTGQ